MIDDCEGRYKLEGGSQEKRPSASGTGPRMLYRFLV
jgi:hypothetical protein